jgi:hypothetical protein
MSNKKDSQIQRTDFFFGGAERRAEFLAEPACNCGQCSKCPDCSQYDCSCNDCPPCGETDDWGKVEQAVMLGSIGGTSMTAAAAAGLASTIAMGTIGDGDSAAHTGYHAGLSVWR